MIPFVPPSLSLIVVGAVAIVMSFSVGYKIRGDQEKAKQLTLERGWHEKYKQGVAAAQAAAETAGLALRTESANRAEEMAKLRASLAASRRSGSVRLATCAPAGEPVRLAEKADVDAPGPATVADRSVSLTPEFRLRYDAALSLVVPSGDRAEWAATAAALAGPADLWTVLDNATENAGRWAQCREMMTAAQLWFKQMGWVR